MFHFNAAYMKSQYKQTNYNIYSNDNSSPFQVLGLILMLQRYGAIYRKKKKNIPPFDYLVLVKYYYYYLEFVFGMFDLESPLP